MASVLPALKGTTISCPAAFAAISTPTFPASTIKSAIDIFMSEFCVASNSFFIDCSFDKTSSNCIGLFTSQNFCGDNLILAPLAPPLLSEPLKVEADDHAVLTS